MKKINIFWTTFASKCLDEIKDYIQQETKSESIAEKYVNKLIDRVEQLKDFGDSGQEEELLKHLKQNSRYLIEGNYKIIYQYNNKTIIITDVFHVKQNPLKISKRTKRK